MTTLLFARTLAMTSRNRLARDRETARSVAAKISSFKSYSEDDLRITCLRANGNRVYKLDTGDHRAALRFSGRVRYISPTSEYRNEKSAAEAGITPPCLWHDPERGDRAVGWIDNACELPGGALADDLKCSRLAYLFANLHYGTDYFCDSVTPAHSLAWNYNRSADHDEDISRLYARAVVLLARLDHGLDANCHGDPVRGNILVCGNSGQDLQLIDWEYSHRTSPYWDLAILCNDTDANENDTARLINHYNAVTGRKYGIAPLTQPVLAGFRGVMALISLLWLRANSTGQSNCQSIEAIGRYLEILD